MGYTFEALKISERVWWVGAVDWELRNFHGYLTSRGSTYNAFLIVDEEVTLVDTVKAPFYDEMMSRIASVVDPARISTVVSNHAELDHSGSLPRLLAELGPDTRLIASKPGQAALSGHFHWDREVDVVATGDHRKLGGATLRFAEARMLHWPDSMFSYLDGDGVLFSNDAFGLHLATAERFADEIDPSVVAYESAKYYANILLPYSARVTKLLADFPALGLDVKILAPDHGPIFREDPLHQIGRWETYAQQPGGKKAIVIYDSMWDSTRKLAQAVAEGITGSGIPTKILPLQGTHRSDVVTELLDATGLVVGSPTMNNCVYPTVGELMLYLKGLRPKNKVGASFGSYGWSGEAVRHLDKQLVDMKVHLASEGLRVKYVPDAGALQCANGLGKSVAAAIKERLE